MTRSSWSGLRRRLVPFLLAGSVWGASGTVQACPVCFQPKNENNRYAFIATTVLLSLLPLAMIGGGILILRRKYQEAEFASKQVDLSSSGDHLPR